MKKVVFISICVLSSVMLKAQQQLSLATVLDSIKAVNPLLKMYDNDIRSMDEAAKGARNWMPAEFGAGFFMTPYNVNRWKKMEDGMGGTEEGMGQFMLSAQQMFPNRKKQNAEFEYMSAMSSVEKEKKNYSLNQLYAEAKKNYYEWTIIQKKINVIGQNERLLNFMIQSAEIRYKNGLEKINAYYKAKAALGNLEKMKVMLENEVLQKRITLNTLMNRDKLAEFSVDTIYSLKDYSAYVIDSTGLAASRSDLKAVNKEIHLNWLKFKTEKTKLKPEFGIRYEHMFGFGGLPMQYTLMGMMKIPFTRGASRMYKANMESIVWKNESLQQQRQMILNEAAGMAQSMQSEIAAKQKQIRLYEEKIIPALRNNYSAYQLAYEQNTEELFMLFDAWETLNMTQVEYLDQLRELLMMQVELERVLEIK
ncbi:TolC family protein [Terrimonas pollutisoli]|uniref:TolC family protein n=1 Tax=Terrimonas pollutisoli TaxID=3034147 RepID=UPI0023EDDE0A|nr:TolC family protein [Terrimonas sp. H1YJ31]